MLRAVDHFADRQPPKVAHAADGANHEARSKAAADGRIDAKVGQRRKTSDADAGRVEDFILPRQLRSEVSDARRRVDDLDLQSLEVGEVRETPDELSVAVLLPTLVRFGSVIRQV